MKLNAALAKSLLMAASIGMIVPVAAQTYPKPTKPATPAPAPTEEPAKVDGLELARKSGGFLGLTVEGPRLVLKFYDAEKKPVDMDAVRASARWDPVNKTNDVYTVLNPSPDGKTLVSPLVVQPPLTFKVYLTLIAADGTVIESLVADLRQLNKAKK